jgi:cyclopropane-fatty-acyl-phospholipid synthase
VVPEEIDAVSLVDAIVDSGVAPDAAIRFAVRSLLRARLRREAAANEADRAAIAARVVGGELSPRADAANEQHYEAPAAFFELCLGPRLKYSSCLFPNAAATLADAENAMLEAVATRARLEGARTILDLGCGWGSFALFAAERFPNASILAVSNSRSQRAFIEARRDARGLRNLVVETSDVAAFDPKRRFDRVVSVEMFEHLGAYAELFRRVAAWLEPDGRLFVHVFAHRTYAYPFVDRGGSDWMARHFFTGGIMPSEPLLPSAAAATFDVEERAWVDGSHYARTAEAWLSNLDGRRDSALRVLADAYGAGEARKRLRRWRVFFIACAELFAYDGDRHWGVAHYRFAPKRARVR